MRSAAAGRVCTGFSKPYIAPYSHTGSTVTYGTPVELARGVQVSVEPEVTDDNRFYANNIVAENEEGVFNGATVTFKVDGLLISKTALIMGLTGPGESGDGIEHIAGVSRPYYGAAYIARYLSGGVTSFVPTIIRKIRFNPVSKSASTQEAQIEYQTEEISAKAYRSDRTDRSWMWEGVEQETEEAAITAMLAKLAANAE